MFKIWYSISIRITVNMRRKVAQMSESGVDAYRDNIERVTSYYARYVEEMWGVVVLHTRGVLPEVDWRRRVGRFEGRYQEQTGLEHQLYGAADVLTTPDEISDSAILNIGHISERLATRHTELENDLLMDLIAHPHLTQVARRKSHWLSRHRLERHAAAREWVRSELLGAWIDLNAAQILPSEWPRTDETAA